MSIEHAPERQTKSGRLSPTLITDLETARQLGCSRATVWRRVADGTLPPPVRIHGLTRFVNDEIDAVIERAKAARYAPEDAV